MPTKFYYKVYKEREETILAVCDKQVSGKKFSEDKMVLEVRESFYKGSEAGEKKIRELVKEATIINATGENIVQILVELELADQDNIVSVGGTPHAQVVILK